MDLSIKFDKEDLKCVVCYEYPTNYIHTCSNGTHILCNLCKMKYEKSDCPICRGSSEMQHSSYLDKLIFTKCPNKACKEKILSIDTNHIEKCIYTEQDCMYCDTKVTITDFEYHLMEKHSWVYYQKNTLNIERNDNKKYIVELSIDPKDGYCNNVLLLDTSSEMNKISYFSTNTENTFKNIQIKEKSLKISTNIDIPISKNFKEIIWISVDKLYYSFEFKISNLTIEDIEDEDLDIEDEDEDELDEEYIGDLIEDEEDNIVRNEIISNTMHEYHNLIRNYIGDRLPISSEEEEEYDSEEEEYDSEEE